MESDNPSPPISLSYTNYIVYGDLDELPSPAKALAKGCHRSSLSVLLLNLEVVCGLYNCRDLEFSSVVCSEN